MADTINDTINDTNTDDKMTKYRNIIVSQLCSDSRIVSILSNGNDETDGYDLVWNRIFPFEYVPDVTSSASPYICFDIVADDNSVNTFQNMSIYFFISTHYSISAQRSGMGLVCDELAHRVQLLFNDKLISGVGKCKFISNHIYAPSDDFRGRVLRFDVRDFNYWV